MPWISLIGFMCSGKSSTGRMLARQLGWPHYDTDALIVEHMGMEIEQIFNLMGEAAFRELEYRIVEELPPERDLVLSTGGGLVLSESSMQILHVQGPIFWLRVDPEDVHERCQRPWAARRPMLEGARDLRQRIETLMTGRAPLYRKWGQPVEGGFDHPRDAARHIMDLLRQRDDFGVYFGRGTES